MFTQDTSKDVHGKASYNRTSLVGQMVKHLPTMQETRVQSLGWEDLLEKEVATHLHILRFLILLTILIPTCDSSSLAFSMMYFA